jgi:hypothetical protein
VIELNGGSTWRVVTADGKSWKETFESDAKAHGKKLENGMLDFPLRVTAETYVLKEPEERHEGNYDTKEAGFYIDRLSGAMNDESWRAEKSGNFGTHLTTTGKCSPIDIKANL